ncbi:hypothetical protein IAE16_04655 [Hydrogenobacter sp. T-2]|uniref:hypothetical protein n=1 Tax=Pampinifervens diazotrophicum TaxID=1632018 RepID=UPI002B25A52B|nr:hypothetical protein [Hydrogenobacter sp. T-2]WPM32973.1 hypothetical protein IAE16_04655 [Hydrogenobacter sp. T-2]
MVSLLSVLLLLFADFASAEHHHEDHELHIDCSLCIIQHVQTDAPSYQPSVKFRLIALFVKIEPYLQTLSFRPLLKTTYGRAPPTS